MSKNSSQNINHLSADQKKWFAVYTKFRSEKSVAENLRKVGIQTYLPLIESTKYYKSRKRTTVKPLINHYVFVKIDQAEYLKTLQTPGVISFLKLGSSLISIPDQEIDLLRRIVGEKMDVLTEEWRPNLGDEVEIISGNLTGVRGFLIEKENNKRFVVRLDSLGLQIRIAVDLENLSPLHVSGVGG